MRTLALIIALFVMLLIITPLIPVNHEVSFNYSVKGCAETISGQSSKGLINQSAQTRIDLIENEIIYQRYVTHLCCRKAVVEYEINRSIIDIYEIWSGIGCKCMCYSEINASISGLTPGEYLINVYETGIEPGSNESMTPRLLITEIIQYPG
jgi:hypothetical protein